MCLFSITLSPPSTEFIDFIRLFFSFSFSCSFNFLIFWLHSEIIKKNKEVLIFHKFTFRMVAGQFLCYFRSSIHLARRELFLTSWKKKMKNFFMNKNTAKAFTHAMEKCEQKTRWINMWMAKLNCGHVLFKNSFAFIICRQWGTKKRWEKYFKGVILCTLLWNAYNAMKLAFHRWSCFFSPMAGLFFNTFPAFSCRNNAQGNSW